MISEGWFAECGFDIRQSAFYKLSFSLLEAIQEEAPVFEASLKAFHACVFFPPKVYVPPRLKASR